MTRPCLPRLAIALVGFFIAASLTAQQNAEQKLDDFESVQPWHAIASDGVALKISKESLEARGPVMRLDFDFHGGGGYAVAHRDLPLELPENYEFRFAIRADAPVNNLEFKLLDPTGDNVWWVNKRNFQYPATWTELTIKKRHIGFAWGPLGGGEIRNVAALELAITAGNGGRGTIWIDDLRLRRLQPVRAYTGSPVVHALGRIDRRSPASRILDGNALSQWRGGEGFRKLDIDFGMTRELGGLTIDWDALDYATSYEILRSEDGAHWESVWKVQNGNGGRDSIFLPELETHHLELRLEKSSRGKGYAIGEIVVQPLAFSSSRNAFFRQIAAGSPAGSYPRYFTGEQTYWTVVGVPGDPTEGLINEEGMVETGAGEFSVEPFLWIPGTKPDGQFVTWHDVKTRQTLEKGYLPVPTVKWDGLPASSPLTLRITALASVRAGRSVLQVRYRVENPGTRQEDATLFLALRPFQVNPPEQFLNQEGGTAVIREISYDAGRLRVNGRKTIAAFPLPELFGAASFEQGDITEFLRRGKVPASKEVSDAFSAASAVLGYPLTIPAGGTAVVTLSIPFHDDANGARETEPLTASLEDVIAEWETRLNRVHISIPGSGAKLVDFLRSNLAYILINQDGAAIQPGSRSYQRSWIRDGSLTSTALLRMGDNEDVKAFIEWFAKYQFPSGKIPCCVDGRGADPVPENDSHGEFIYLVMEYYRHTGDRALVESLWPRIVKTVDYIDVLRQQRRTKPYLVDGKPGPFFGLLPESISHEGYSAKPMHSFWDDFFALKGLKDAVEIAGILNRPEQARFTIIRDEFSSDVHRSIRQTMANHKIDYIPGSVELGDFDATSTTTAISPGDELARMPAGAVNRSFDRYYEYFRKRRDGLIESKDYTPYEWRIVGTLLRLGQRGRANELVDFFLKDSRPAGWNHWAEVVRRSIREQGFLGDMPHTWVGSDFMRSMLDMLAYEDTDDHSLILGAGVREEWIEGKGIEVEGLRTHYGSLDFSIRAEGTAVRMKIGKSVNVPSGGIVVRNPRNRAIRAATVDGSRLLPKEDSVVIRKVPADIVLTY